MMVSVGIGIEKGRVGGWIKGGWALCESARGANHVIREIVNCG